MTSISSSLLDFILSLLRDPQAAASFASDPQAALSGAGLGDVCSADVKALMPMLSDYAPVGSSYGAAAFTAHSQSGGQSSGYSGHSPSYGHQRDYDHDRDHGRPEQGHDHDGSLAIEHIRYIQANYTYNNNVTTTTTIDASHSIWGDSYKIFGDDNVIATNGSVAAGDDVGHASVDNSVDNSNHTVVVDSFNRTTTTNTTTNDVHGNGNAVGAGNTVSDAFNPDTHITDSGNTQTGTGNVLGQHNDVSTDNSGNTLGAGSSVGDGSHAGLNTDISNSGNTATNSGNTAVNSGNSVGGNGNAGGLGNSATSTDVDLHAHDIVLGSSNNVGNDLHLDDHSYSSSDGNDINIAGGGIDQSQHETDSHDVTHTITDSFDDNAIAVHGQAEATDVLSHDAVHLGAGA